MKIEFYSIYLSFFFIIIIWRICVSFIFIKYFSLFHFYSTRI